jgi:hypothetical protein
MYSCKMYHSKTEGDVKSIQAFSHLPVKPTSFTSITQQPTHPPRNQRSR